MIVNKKIYVVGFIFLIFLQNTFALSKDDIETYYKIAINKNDKIKYDLIDYIPHSDGEIVLYKIDDKLLFSYIGIYSSMFKKQFYLIIDKNEINGYYQKVNYQSAYDTSNSQIEFIKDIQVEKNIETIEKNEEEKKILRVLLEILNTDFS